MKFWYSYGLIINDEEDEELMKIFYNINEKIKKETVSEKIKIDTSDKKKRIISTKWPKI